MQIRHINIDAMIGKSTKYSLTGREATTESFLRKMFWNVALDAASLK